jgi:hypothetical protein
MSVLVEQISVLVHDFCDFITLEILGILKKPFQLGIQRHDFAKLLSDLNIDPLTIFGQCDVVKKRGKFISFEGVNWNQTFRVTPILTISNLIRSDLKNCGAKLHRGGSSVRFSPLLWIRFSFPQGRGRARL